VAPYSDTGEEVALSELCEFGRYDILDRSFINNSICDLASGDKVP
jgi:hypothetical protein